MLRLFHSPGACSGTIHMALEEAGLPFAIEPVALAKGEQRSETYLRLNPKGRVPVLVDGEFVLTEVAAILRYVSRLAPDKELWPADPREDARCAEWLAWISSGVHPSYAHIRRPERYADGDEARAAVSAKGRTATREIWLQVEAKIAGNGTPFAAGSRFSVADLYLLIFWTWGAGPVLGYDMPAMCPAWTTLARKIAQRPAVQRAAAKDELKLPA